jgi:hypothetical protein
MRDYRVTTINHPTPSVQPGRALLHFVWDTPLAGWLLLFINSDFWRNWTSVELFVDVCRVAFDSYPQDETNGMKLTMKNQWNAVSSSSYTGGQQSILVQL